GGVPRIRRGQLHHGAGPGRRRRRGVGAPPGRRPGPSASGPCPPVRGGHVRVSERQPDPPQGQARSLRQPVLRAGAGRRAVPALRPFRAGGPASRRGGVHLAGTAHHAPRPLARAATEGRAGRHPRVRVAARADARGRGPGEGGASEAALDDPSLDELAHHLPAPQRASGARRGPDGHRAPGRQTGAAADLGLPSDSRQPLGSRLRFPGERSRCGGLQRLRPERPDRSRSDPLRPPEAPVPSRPPLWSGRSPLQGLSNVLLAVPVEKACRIMLGLRVAVRMTSTFEDAAPRWYSHPYNRGNFYRLAAARHPGQRRLRLGLARQIGRLAPSLMPSERAAIETSMARFTGATGPQLEALTLRVFTDFAMCFSDLVSTNRQPAALRSSHLGHVEGIERLTNLSQGLISLTAHVGNWELAGRLLAGKSARPTHVVVAPEEAQELERWVRRNGEGVRFVSRSRPTVSLELLAALRRG